MKLYLLKRRGYVGDDENEVMVVRAESREAARLLASRHGRGFERDLLLPNERQEVWLTSDPETGSTCEGIDPEGPEGVLCCSFHASERRYG